MAEVQDWHRHGKPNHSRPRTAEPSDAAVQVSARPGPAGDGRSAPVPGPPAHGEQAKTGAATPATALRRLSRVCFIGEKVVENRCFCCPGLLVPVCWRS